MAVQENRPRQIDGATQWFAGLSRGTQVTLVAGLLGLVASFFSWYGVSASYESISYSASVNAWRDWGYLAILGFAVAPVVALLVARGGSLRAIAPGLPPSVTDARVVVGAGSLATLATVLFMTSEGRGISGGTFDGAGAGISAGPGFGAYCGLLCAIAIAVGGALLIREGAGAAGPV